MHSVRRNDAAISYKTQQPHQHLRIVHVAAFHLVSRNSHRSATPKRRINDSMKEKRSTPFPMIRSPERRHHVFVNTRTLQCYEV